MKIEIKMSELRGAVARAWCSPHNEHKVMDPDIACDAAAEVAMILINKGISIVEDNEITT